MSVAHRSIARLPLDIFEDLITSGPEGCRQDAASLRLLICTKGIKATEPITAVGQLLKLSSHSLLRALDPLLTHVECQELVRRISVHCAPSPITALDLLHGTPDSSPRRRYLPTGLPSLDKCLFGGFCQGTISELVGRAAVGKSQLAMQMCVMAAKYGHGSVYIDTEKKLSLGRLKEIAEERSYGTLGMQIFEEENDGDFSYGGTVPLSATQGVTLNDFYDEDGNVPYKSAREVLSNVTIHTAGSTNELLSVVKDMEDEILFRNLQSQEDPSVFPVRLVILDSVAAPTRRDFGSESAPQRVAAVMQVAQLLKRLADELQLVVVVTNQVVRSDNVSLPENRGTDLIAVKAALGTAWHHCLSTRLLMEHDHDPHQLDKDPVDSNGNIRNTSAWRHEQGRIRRATVVKSNVCGRSSVFYEVTSIGLAEIRFDDNEM